MSSETIQELKDKLTLLGISTNTPGLKGEQRRQELLNRLEEYEIKNENLNKNENDNNKNFNEINTKYNVPSVSDLSLTEIRSRLTMLGESTNTPGLTGEDRRNELLKRLINSICRSDDTGDQMIDELLSADLKNSNNNDKGDKSDKNNNDDDKSDKSDMDLKNDKKNEDISLFTETKIEKSNFLYIPTESSTNISEEDIMKSKRELMKKEERIKTTELSEIKKHLNNVVNRRAIVISSRYEGDNQDEKLNQLNTLSNQIEQELKRIQNLSKKNKTDKVIQSSSQLIENNTKMSVDNLISKLNKALESTKEKIKRQKNKIKCEEENSPIYGIEVEEADKVRIQELNYEIAKIKRDIEKMAVGVSIIESSQLQSSSSLSSVPLSSTKPSDNFEYSENESDFRKVSNQADSKNDSFINSKNKGKGSKKQVQKKSSFDTFEGSDIGITEDDLAAIKPFEPYKDDKDDDLLKLKMEMLRNRNKINSNKKIDTNIIINNSSNNMDNNKIIVNNNKENLTNESETKEHHDISPSSSSSLSLSKGLEIGSENTAFSNRRYNLKSTQSPKYEHKSPQKEIKEENITNEIEDLSLPPPSNKITQLKQQLKQHDNDDEEESGDDNISEPDDEIDAQLIALRQEAINLEKQHDFDGVEEVYLKALNLRPFDLRTLDTFATFLHRKKGELGRAEAFYRRAIQLYLPSMIHDITSPSKQTTQSFDWDQILNSSPLKPIPKHNPENGDSALPIKRLTSILLHYASFLRRAKGDLSLAEIVLKKAAEMSPTDSVVLGNCAHFLAEEAYGNRDNLESKASQHYHQEASSMFVRAMKADPSNINNMLWYAKFLHKSNQINQAEVMYRAALQKSKCEGKIGATVLCNYAIFLYRHKKDPEQAARLFCEGIEKFPNHKGIQKNYKAMKKDLEKQMNVVRSKLPLIHESNESEYERGSSAHLSSRMPGMKAKLYQDVQSAEDYQLSISNPVNNEEKNEEKNININKINNRNEDINLNEFSEGIIGLNLYHLTCHITNDYLKVPHENIGIYWILHAGSGTLSDRNYESDIFLFSQYNEWKYSITVEESEFPQSPYINVSLNDHLCIEFYQIDMNLSKNNHKNNNSNINIENEFRQGVYFGSVIIPIEDIVHSTPTTSTSLISSNQSKLYHLEETILNDENQLVGHIELQLFLQ